MNRLKNNTDIVIKPADEGGATVIMDADDYVKEAMRQLSNQEYYVKIDSDRTNDHEQMINQCIEQLILVGELDREKGELLKPTNSRTPIFYLLPKIHKVNNPGRPVVSSVRSHTEKLSAYVDEFLKPLAEKLPSYIKDTTDFIICLRSLGKLPNNCYLATLDVSSLYTNIDINEGLKIVEKELETQDQVKPTARTITTLLEKVLKMNNFTFNGEHFIQVKGTAMGTRAAPNFAHVYMGNIEKQFVYETPWINNIILWKRFIDDIFLIWGGDSESLITFINHLNNAVPLIKYTHEISQNEVNFLDTTVKKDTEGNISTDVYQKPTDTHPYLNWNSAHPLHLKRSIPYSQALRLRRICSNTETLEKRLTQYAEYFVACGFKQQKVRKEMNKVLKLTQEQCLVSNRKESQDRIPFVITYNPYTTYIAEIANRHWDFLKTKERLGRIFNKNPLVAYRRPSSLRDALVSTKFKRYSGCSDGFTKCSKPRCSWCNLIHATNTFKGIHDARKYKILHPLDCQSSWVIYIIQCVKCGLQYVGKSETNLNIRLNNHRNHIKKAFNSCELTDHFLTNKYSHEFERDISITAIEQITSTTMNINRKKELLQAREIFWQRKLKSIQPRGLNKRLG